MANQVYNIFKMGTLAGTFDLQSASAPVYVALVNNSYSPNVDTDEYYSSISAYETAGAGYTQGGAALSTPTLATITGSDLGKFDAADWFLANVTLSGTGTVRYGVLYASSGAAAVAPLICYFDFTTDQAVTAGTFTIQWSGNGILNLT